jgi:hypothetical protein
MITLMRQENAIHRKGRRAEKSFDSDTDNAIELLEPVRS